MGVCLVMVVVVEGCGWLLLMMLKRMLSKMVYRFVVVMLLLRNSCVCVGRWVYRLGMVEGIRLSVRLIEMMVRLWVLLRFILVRV